MIRLRSLTNNSRSLSRPRKYLKSTITRFPDLIATRKAALYAETTNLDMRARKIDFEPMHLLDKSEEGVVYRQGQEIVDADARKRSQRRSQTANLTTYGVFGPSLQIMREIVTDPSLRYRGAIGNRTRTDAGPYSPTASPPLDLYFK